MSCTLAPTPIAPRAEDVLTASVPAGTAWDSRTQRMDRVRKALSVHTLVFCCAVVACLVVGPLVPGARYLIPWLLSDRGRVQVELQSPHVRCVSVPFGGRFVAAKALFNGTEVVKGQVLGVVEATPIPREPADAERKYADLQAHLLRLEAQRGQGIAGEPGLAAGVAREARDTALKLREQEREIARLRELKAKLTVTSPVSGRVSFGLAASRPVGAHETICSIDPRTAPTWSPSCTARRPPSAASSRPAAPSLSFRRPRGG